MTFWALFGSEIRRLLARRAVRWGTAIALAIALLVVVVVAINSTGTGPTDHTMLLRQLWFERGGHVEDNTVLAMSTYLFILVVVIGATAVGGDYRAGTAGTVLTWEPRRVRVALARIGAVKVVALGMYLVFIAVFIAGWWAGAALRGSTAGLGQDFWSHLAIVVLRCALAVVILAVITAGLAYITRGTVGAMMVWFGYLIAIEGILANRFRWIEPSLLLPNLAAFLQGSDVVFTSRDDSGLSFANPQRYLASPGSGFTRALMIALVVGGLGILSYRRRDVT